MPREQTTELVVENVNQSRILKTALLWGVDGVL